MGGGGTDRATYVTRTNPVTVTLDNLANDGEAGEGDNVQTEDVDGGTAADVLSGDANSNTLTGGPGADTLDGGTGADLLVGGGGTERATYVTRTTPVTVTLDNLANDGAVGEGDNVQTEDVDGGTAADVLSGDANSNTLTGGPGADALDGGTGADLLVGGAGTDLATYRSRQASVTVLLDNVENDGQAGEGDNVQTENVAGGAAADVLSGDGGPNSLQGRFGDDRLYGNGGNDNLDGSGGNDVLVGGAGRDVLEGNTGIDTADYSGRGNPVKVTLDGLQNDGAVGEGDNVRRRT